MGQALTGSNLVAKLSFTGSTAVGKVRIEERERERRGGMIILILILPLGPVISVC